MTSEEPEPKVWQRPVPVIGDATSAAERAAAPDGWRLPDQVRAGLYETIGARRDIRRYRPDPIDEATLTRVLEAGHAAPSVGHSQPWRFIIVADQETRDRAAWIADRERLAQAALLDPEAGRHLLDLQLEGIREAPLGVIVCCDRRTAAAGVLGRATFPDSDMWSCACAIQNLWLAARAEGLGMGWVTLFPPDELCELLGLPDEVSPLGWLCLGWPDERPPSPGLERAGWSKRQPLADVVIRDRWPTADDAPDAPISKLRGPDQPHVVGARDDADELLTPLGSLGVIDRVVDRLVALDLGAITGGTLVLAVGRHRVTDLGVSAFDPSVTDEVLAAARAGEALGCVAAVAAGLRAAVVDAGSSTGDLLHADAMTSEVAASLVEQGRVLGASASADGLVALGEIGIGNTTVAAALTAALLGLSAADVVGLGAGADSSILAVKRDVVAGALDRVSASGAEADPLALLASLGGPEFAVLTGVVLGTAAAGGAVVLDGLATSAAALTASLIEPGVVSHLVAGQRSRERAHALVLTALGLEPLLDLRFRAGEGAGASFACSLIFQALTVRARTARTN